MSVVSVTLQRGPNGLGFNIKGGKGHSIPIVISKIDPNGPAARISDMQIGAQLLSVNGVSVQQATHAEAVAMLKRDGAITMTLLHTDMWKGVPFEAWDYCKSAVEI